MEYSLAVEFCLEQAHIMYYKFSVILLYGFVFIPQVQVELLTTIVVSEVAIMVLWD